MKYFKDGGGRKISIHYDFFISMDDISLLLEAWFLNADLLFPEFEFEGGKMYPNPYGGESFGSWRSTNYRSLNGKLNTLKKKVYYHGPKQFSDYGNCIETNIWVYLIQREKIAPSFLRKKINLINDPSVYLSRGLKLDTIFPPIRSDSLKSKIDWINLELYMFQVVGIKCKLMQRNVFTKEISEFIFL